MPSIASRLLVLVLAAYLAILSGWMWFASRVAPGWIESARTERAGPSLTAAVRWFGGDGPLEGVLKRWDVAASAIGGGLLIHAMLVAAILRGSRSGLAGVATSSILIIASFLFLVFAALVGDIQDYHLFLDIWREVLAGHDPWFLVIGGMIGPYSLNAYGPLFTLLAPATLWNSLGPKLLFAATYWAFASWLALSAPRRGLPRWVGPGLAVWFAGPFAWVEIAVFGHFDVLVAVLCVAAIECRARGRWVAAGGWTSIGVLLKYFPAILAPFMSLDRGRFRWRWLVAVAGLSAGGLGVAWAIWGASVFRPFALAAQRESAGLSIFRVLRGAYSPIGRDDLFFSTDEYSGPVLLLGLFLAWRWARRNGLEPVAASVMATTVTLTLYKVGFPQYYMIVYLLVPYWFVRRYDELRYRGRLVAAYGTVFILISYYDLLMAWSHLGLYDEWIGAAVFTLMAGLVAAIGASGRKETPEVVSRPTTTPGSLPG